MTLDQAFELLGAVLAGGFLGTAIKGWVDRRNGKDTNANTKDANDNADWKAFCAEQRETFATAMDEQRKAHDRAIGAMNDRIATLESKFNTEHDTLNVALSHLRELRACRICDVPPLPKPLEGRL
ncbi:hypothetical protein DDK07_07860 [Mycobacteroides abscessus]|uniref:hypothetical protein n=1 Tax=Mycobacteroides abscessus TaxID=36809 RepID=UPI000C25BCC0|nr:hypothetical protein [Mycobacteroides abscessus]MDO3023410.1 hypothetical protein [Mycobacteroides abscessus subsp. abscessus]PVB51175.1 hypothetical protein DDK07_07860 [Mycobacteroides abscessus]RIR80170.1 hypothetical protein D2E68_04035 [Mycobacteroides abscessus]RIT29986.1 hypothetical protein D2E73_00570 [Mycobacteroides abscessus]RIT38014.1 hypothetical protein D2E99_00570 [Mycobacteroides abscessus]